ncbi:DUF808 family protein [Bradyrhizobium sp. WBOS07]|uniref:DUF808 family protein n=1 Tax=Bradyrhizobium sp. WBOS07 TaxID=2171499 RepID=UPI00211F0D05|nr:DUF808 family protein [Bradyrhizobium sp. WBOS07]
MWHRPNDGAPRCRGCRKTRWPVRRHWLPADGSRPRSPLSRTALGKGLLIIAPWLMKALSIVGTLAMFLVGGGIVVHGIAPLHHAIEHFAGQQSAVVAMILPTVLNLILGFIIGGIVVLGVKAVAKMRGQAH